MLPRDVQWLHAHQGKKEEGDDDDSGHPPLVTGDILTSGSDDHRTSAPPSSPAMSFPTSAVGPNPIGQNSPIGPPINNNNPWASAASSWSKFQESQLTKSTQSSPPSTFQTLTSSSTSNQAYSELNTPPVTKTSSSSNGAFTTSGADDAADTRPGYDHKKHASQTPIYAAAAVSVLTFAIMGFIIYFCMRKRKRQNQALAAVTVPQSQMKQRDGTAQALEIQAYMAATTAPPTSLTREPSYTAPPSGSPPPHTPPPVILGPISAGSNGNYFTGIDTSDLVSITSNDQHRPADLDRSNAVGLGNPFADSNSLNEEPPPPYRPRSVFLASSRGSLAPSSSSVASSSHNRGLEGDGVAGVRSPFDDAHGVFDDSDSFVSTRSDALLRGRP
ncbi:unnamed protein product [Periconia digitata]|uniref:Uncharacterized protein n=1 Tax=Periconia digitata TaxID=1303443 RepID=A0A9W4UI04_9PLEO|nr:unnamed protein product [Periconia digitata]